MPDQPINRRRASRRRLLAALLAAVPAALAVEARWFEPTWLRVRRCRLAKEKPTHKLVHLTDIHYKGDRAYLAEVVRKVNAESPDLVCFTGDFVEEGQHLAEALQLLACIKSPIYGVPGNHDYWAQLPFGSIANCLQSTGGRWLLDQQAVTADGKVNVLGASCISMALKKLGAVQAGLDHRPGMINVLLMHYPAWVTSLSATYDLILSGHSHGGQVRLPFIGPLVVPFGVDQYDLGWFKTAAGKMYVGPGIGWFHLPIRFNCRPEITVIEI